MVDLSLGYDLGRVSERLQGARADLIASNLFDQEYYTCYNNMNCWYGAERTIELKLGYQSNLPVHQAPGFGRAFCIRLTRS